MIGKMMSMGFDLATMPARLTWRSARAMTMSTAEFSAFSDELRQASEDAVREGASKLKSDRRVAWFQVESENQESIHNHSAYAMVVSS